MPVLSKTYRDRMSRQKILLIRFSSIGDIVLITPVIRVFKKQLDAEVHLLVKASYQNVLANNPYVDKIHTLHHNLWHTISQLRKENFTLVVDLQKNLSSVLISKGVCKNTLTYQKLNVEKWLTVRLKRSFMPKINHIVDRYFEAIRPVGVVDDGEGLDYFFSRNEREEAFRLVKEIQFIALVLGATYTTKRIPKEKCTDIIAKSSLPVVLLGGNDVLALSEELQKKHPDKTLNFCGKTSLGVGAGILKLASKVVTGDTGMMHIAAALKKEIVVLWGNTTPTFGMSPYYGKNVPDVSTNLEVEGLSCRPCSKLGFHHCPKSHFRCMNDLVITVDDLMPQDC